MKNASCLSPRALFTLLTACSILVAGELHPGPAAAQTPPAFVDSGQVLGVNSSDVVLGDLDRDGDLDILWVVPTTNSQIWLNQGRDPATGLLRFTKSNLPSFNFVAAALADWDGDGDLDVVMVQFNPGGPPFRSYRNLGVNAQGVVQLVETGLPWGPNGCEHLALGDLDGDGLPDAFLTCPDGDHVFLNNPPGVFTDSGQSLPNGSGRRVVLRDVDNDGDLDAYVSARGTAADRIWTNQGGLQGGMPATFADSGQGPGLGRFKSAAALGDVSGDGFADVVLPGSAPPYFYLNQGADPPQFTWKGLAADPRSQPTFEAVDNGVALADLDGIPGLDIALGASTGEIRLFLNDGQGLFQPGAGFGTADLTNFNKVIALGDMDGDRRIDAVIAGSGANAGRIWLNGFSSLPPAAIFSSTPPRGTRIDFGLVSVPNPIGFRGFFGPVRWIWLANTGGASLNITGVSVTSDSPSVMPRVLALDSPSLDAAGQPAGNVVPLPHTLAAGGRNNPLAVALQCAATINPTPGPRDGVVSIRAQPTDLSAPEFVAAEFPYQCDFIDEYAGFFEVVAAALTRAAAPTSATARAAAVTAATATCSDTVTLAMHPSASHALDAQIPDAYGGGTLHLTEFSGSLTASLLPIPADPNRCALRVDGGTFTAPSVPLPSGVATGPNTLTFGPTAQSDGVIDMTTGSFTATAGGRIVNDLFPEGILIAGFYTGTMDLASGSISVQSNTRDAIPVTTVADGTPPVITPLVSGPLGANGWYVGDVAVSWTVSDPESNLTAITGCAAATVTTDTSGRSFDCAATSTGGTTTAPSVTVRRDAAPPILTGVPDNITAAATSATGATVDYVPPSATDAMSGNLAVNCAPLTGSAFPIGTTAVTCAAIDAAGNAATASFTVTVQPLTPPPGSERTICTTLGGKGLLDVDLFQFEGIAQEQVTVRAAADPAGTSRGSRAALALFGNKVLRVNAGALPNAVAATLPRTGSYYVTMTELLLAKDKFTGAYCITLQSSMDGWQSFRQR